MRFFNQVHMNFEALYKVMYHKSEGLPKESFRNRPDAKLLNGGYLFDIEFDFGTCHAHMWF